jgi:tripartite-type tricarboxylate transporter receptor subunit TctC
MELPMKRLIASTLFVLAATAAQAQTFPTKQITIIVPFAAGGPTDVVTRLISEPMSKILGQPVIVENVAGAGGTTGMTRVKDANPDGHIIGVGHTGTQAASAALYPNLKYDSVKDFSYIGVLNTNAIYIAAKKTIPANTLGEFVAYLKANEKTVNQAHAGIGSVSHTTGLLFNSVIGIKPQTVPYRGTGPAMNDLVGGQIDYILDQVVNVAPQANAGTIKAFAVAQDKRNPIMPNVPTTAEAGLPAFKTTVWNVVLAPKGIPADVLKKLNDALVKSLQDPAVSAKLIALGAEIPDARLVTPDGAQAFVAAERDVWTPVIKAAGVTAE